VANLSATLSLGGAGISGKTITFTVGSQSITALTNRTGYASAMLLLDQVPGTYSVIAAFASDGVYTSGNDQQSFTISKRAVTADLTGDVSKVVDGNASATLTPSNYILNGLIAGDMVSLNNPVSGNYDNGTVGTQKNVFVNGLALIGVNADRYSLSSSSVSANIGTITSANKSALLSAPLVAPTINLKVYPNHSRGPVTFDFQVSINADVVLDITTVSGQRIARIFDSRVEANVTQTVIFDRSLSPGVYLYILRWNNEIVTGKFIKTR